MANNSQKRGKKLGSKIRFRGIGEDAKVLHVSAPYLWKILTGRVTHKEVESRYWNLKREQARTLLAETEQAA